MSRMKGSPWGILLDLVHFKQVLCFKYSGNRWCTVMSQNQPRKRMPVRLKSKARPSKNQKMIREQKVLKQWQVLIEGIRRTRAC
jgi:hypothetical protein